MIKQGGPANVAVFRDPGRIHDTAHKQIIAMSAKRSTNVLKICLQVICIVYMVVNYRKTSKFKHENALECYYERLLNAAG